MRKKSNKHKKKKEPKTEFGRICKKIWWFLWEDDSIWSWLVNIVLAFVLIKFIVYPVLGLVFMTSHPIVAVVSSSMEHDGSFDEWWASAALCDGNTIRCDQQQHYAEYSLTKEEFKEFGFKNGFNKGDIMILFGTRPEKIEVGDVIVFQGERPDPIIHRVIKIEGENENMMFYTKGDHNPTSFGFELGIPDEKIIGTAKVRIPLLGYIKIWFVQLISWIL